MTITLDGTLGITAPAPEVLQGSTSGSITLAVPAVAGSNTITFPAVTGSLVVAGQTSAITSGTSQASTSGTSIDFTSLPSTVKRITVMLNGVSTSGTSAVQVQLGTSGGVTTTGYVSQVSNSSTLITSTTGLVIWGALATDTRVGVMVITNITGNTWICSGLNFSSASANGNGNFSGIIALSGVLTSVRITTVNGTDTFDAGSVNILWE